MRKTALYRHFDAAGGLLYVGISKDAGRRISEHSKSDWFDAVERVEVEFYPTRDAALAAEKTAIRTERPAHNKTVGGMRRAVSGGATPLAQVLGETGLSQKQFGDLVGVNQATISKFAKAKARPGLALALKIERETNGAVPVSCWFEAEGTAA